MNKEIEKFSFHDFNTYNILDRCYKILLKTNLTSILELTTPQLIVIFWDVCQILTTCKTPEING